MSILNKNKLEQNPGVGQGENLFDFNTDDIDQEFIEKMQKLHKEQEGFKINGNFVEAGEIKKEVVSLIKNYERVQMEEFEKKMNLKLEAIDREHDSQFESFEEFWKNKLNHYDIESEEILEKTAADQKNEYHAFIEETEKTFGKNMKMSAKYLDILYKLELLSKNQRFEEAASLKEQLEEEYHRCLERNNKNNEKKIESLVSKFSQKQSKEMNTLKMKIEINRKELLKSKKIDYDNIIKKYKAHRQSIENKINLARNQKLKFLEAFDPSKNINVSNLYTRFLEDEKENEAEFKSIKTKNLK
jgi:hypothetical protein